MEEGNSKLSLATDLVVSLHALDAEHHSLPCVTRNRPEWWAEQRAELHVAFAYSSKRSKELQYSLMIHCEKFIMNLHCMHSRLDNVLSYSSIRIIVTIYLIVITISTRIYRKSYRLYIRI